MDVDFIITEHGSAFWKKAVELREHILRKPLGQTFTEKELDEEKNHVQVVGMINNKVEATSVLVPEEGIIKMQRVVVSDKYRNLEIGSKMMRFCEQFAKEKGFQFIYCHARDSAVNFYLKNSYNKVGDYFDEDGIPHLKMEKALQIEK